MKSLKSEINGKYIWFTLLFAVIIVSIQRQQMAVLSEYISSRLNIDETQVVNLATSTMYGLMLMQIPSGILIDKYGVRKTNIISLLGITISSIIIFYTRSYYIALICRFVIGLGLSTIPVSVFKVQSEWFNADKFTFMSAVMMFIMNLGAFLTTIPLSILLNKLGGEKTMMLMTMLTTMSLLLVIVFVKDISWKNQKNIKFSTVSSLKGVLGNKYTWAPMTLTFFMLATTSSLLGFWAIPFLRETYSLTTIDAAGYFSYFTAGFMLGAVVSSIVDKIKFLNYKRNLILFTFLYAFSWFYVIVMSKGKPPLNQLPIIFMIMGISVTNHLFSFTAVKTVNNVENIGIATSVVSSMDFFGSVILNALISYKLSEGYTINQSFKIILLFSILAFISSFFVKYEKVVID